MKNFQGKTFTEWNMGDRIDILEIGIGTKVRLLVCGEWSIGEVTEIRDYAPDFTVKLTGGKLLDLNRMDAFNLGLSSIFPK